MMTYTIMNKNMLSYISNDIPYGHKIITDIDAYLLLSLMSL